MRLHTRKWRNDFNNNYFVEQGYDLFDDWDLVASSLKAQYKYSIRQEIDKLSWAELCSDIAGLNSDTPLGNIVRIRTEKDFKTIQNFSNEEKRIRSEWINRKNKEILNNLNYDEIVKQSKALSSALMGMCEVNKPQEKAGDKM